MERKALRATIDKNTAVLSVKRAAAGKVGGKNKAVQQKQERKWKGGGKGQACAAARRRRGTHVVGGDVLHDDVRVHGARPIHV